MCLLLYTSSDLPESSRKQKESLREATRKVASSQHVLFITRTTERFTDGINGEIDEREKEIVPIKSRNNGPTKGFKRERKGFDENIIDIATVHEVGTLSLSSFLLPRCSSALS